MKKRKKDKKIKGQKEKDITTFITEKFKELLLFNGILYVVLAVIYIFYIGFYLKGDIIAKKAINWLFAWIIGGAIVVSIYDFLFDYFSFRKTISNTHPQK